MELKRLLDTPRRSSVELIALANDTRDELKLMADKIEKADGTTLNFTLLSDTGHRVIDRYGLLNQDRDGIPHPTVYVIDRSGTVRWKFTEINYRIRPTNALILEAVDAALRRERQ